MIGKDETGTLMLYGLDGGSEADFGSAGSHRCWAQLESIQTRRFLNRRPPRSYISRFRLLVLVYRIYQEIRRRPHSFSAPTVSERLRLRMTELFSELRACLCVRSRAESIHDVVGLNWTRTARWVACIAYCLSCAQLTSHLDAPAKAQSRSTVHFESPRCPIYLLCRSSAVALRANGELGEEALMPIDAHTWMMLMLFAGMLAFDGIRLPTLLGRNLPASDRPLRIARTAVGLRRIVSNHHGRSVSMTCFADEAFTAHQCPCAWASDLLLDAVPDMPQRTFRTAVPGLSHTGWTRAQTYEEQLRNVVAKLIP